MTRTEMIKALTEYELLYLHSNIEDIKAVTDFFATGGYTTMKTSVIESIYNFKFKGEVWNLTQVEMQ